MQKEMGRISWAADKFGQPPCLEELKKACEYAHNKNKATELAHQRESNRILKSLQYFGSSIKTTYLGMEKERAELLARLQSKELDEPVFYTTLSNADALNAELFHCLDHTRDINDISSIPYETRQKELNDNPVLAARIYRARMKAMIDNVIFSDELPFGAVTDQWHRHRTTEGG